MTRKILSIVLSLGLLFQQGGLVYAAGELNLANYLSSMQSAISQPDRFQPARLRYISYDINNNDFKLLLDKGDSVNQRTEGLKNRRTMEPLNSPTPKLNNATQELFNYFLIGLALSNDTFWVNLRPDAPENIIDPLLEKTDIGKIFLEADLQLKKDTASLTSPQNPEGKAYWDKLYKKAGELFGTENITIPTITRPWIVPNEVIVRETEDSAYIYKATLKVMLEADYLADQKTEKPKNGKTEEYGFSDPRLKELNEYSSQLIRETIIPRLTREVNSSKRYAKLRQVYYSLVLSRWFKQKYQGLSPKGTVPGLIDSRDLTNLTSKEPYDKQTYFQAYQKSFNDGEYNLKEPVTSAFGQSIRSYVSGGVGLSASPIMPGAVKTNNNTQVERVLNSGLISGSQSVSTASPMTVEEAKKNLGDIIKESVSIDIFPAEVKAKFAEYNDIIKKKFEGVVKDNNIPEARKDIEKLARIKGFLMYVMNKYDKIGDKSQAPEVFKKISSLQTDLKQALNNELSPLKEFASKINSGEITDVSAAILTQWEKLMADMLYPGKYRAFVKHLTKENIKYTPNGSLIKILNLERAGKRATQIKIKAGETLEKKYNPGDKFIFNDVLPDIASEINLGGISTDIIVNANPLLWGNVLVLPNPNKCFSQYFNEEAAIAALNLLDKINKQGYKLGFNGPGAFASVPQLHLQGFDYFDSTGKDKLPVEDAGKKPHFFVNDNLSITTLSNWPVNTIVLTGRPIDSITKAVILLTDILHKRNQPFNIVFTKNSDNSYTVYVFPRRLEGPGGVFGTGVAFLELSGVMLFTNQNFGGVMLKDKDEKALEGRVSKLKNIRQIIFGAAANSDIDDYRYKKTTNGDYVYYARHKRSDKSREIVDSDLDNPFMHYIDLSKDIDNIYQIINDNKKLKDRYEDIVSPFYKQKSIDNYIRAKEEDLRKDIAVVTIGDDMFERIVEDYKNQLNNLFFSASPIATFKDKINEVVNEIEKKINDPWLKNYKEELGVFLNNLKGDLEGPLGDIDNIVNAQGTLKDAFRAIEKISIILFNKENEIGNIHTDIKSMMVSLRRYQLPSLMIEIEKNLWQGKNTASPLTVEEAEKIIESYDRTHIPIPSFLQISAPNDALTLAHYQKQENMPGMAYKLYSMDKGGDYFYSEAVIIKHADIVLTRERISDILSDENMLDLSEPGDNLESLMSYKEIGDFLYKKIRVLENKLSNAPASIPRGNAINKEPKEMRVELKKLCLEAYEKELIGHMYSMPGLSKGRLSTMERCLIDDKLAGAINIARDFFSDDGLFQDMEEKVRQISGVSISDIKYLRMRIILDNSKEALGQLADRLKLQRDNLQNRNSPQDWVLRPIYRWLSGKLSRKLTAMIEEIADISKDYLWGDMVEDIKIMNDKGMLLSGDSELHKIFYVIQAYLNDRFIQYKWGKENLLKIGDGFKLSVSNYFVTAEEILKGNNPRLSSMYNSASKTYAAIEEYKEAVKELEWEYYAFTSASPLEVKQVVMALEKIRNDLNVVNKKVSFLSRNGHGNNIQSISVPLGQAINSVRIKINSLQKSKGVWEAEVLSYLPGLEKSLGEINSEVGKLVLPKTGAGVEESLKILSTDMKAVLSKVGELYRNLQGSADSPIGVMLSQETPDTWRLVRYGNLSEPVKASLYKSAQNSFPDIKLPEFSENDMFVFELNEHGGVGIVLGAWISGLKNGIYLWKYLDSDRKMIINNTLNDLMTGRKSVASPLTLREAQGQVDDIFFKIVDVEEGAVSLLQKEDSKVRNAFLESNILEEIAKYYKANEDAKIKNLTDLNRDLKKIEKQIVIFLRDARVADIKEEDAYGLIRDANESVGKLINKIYNGIMKQRVLSEEFVRNEISQIGTFRLPPGKELVVYDENIANKVVLRYVSAEELAELRFNKETIRGILQEKVFRTKITVGKKLTETIYTFPVVSDAMLERIMCFAVKAGGNRLKSIEGMVVDEDGVIAIYGNSSYVSEAIRDAWNKEHPERKVSSAVVAGQSIMDEKRGGIDLTDRALHIKLERVGSFASTPLLLPQVKNAQNLDLDKEFEQVEALVSSGINPNSRRILELFSACHYRGEFGQRLNQIISCLKSASAIQEAEAIDSDEDFRLALMMPEVLS